jgi:hypothetical protein
MILRLLRFGALSSHQDTACVVCEATVRRPGCRENRMRLGRKLGAWSNATKFVEKGI